MGLGYRVGALAVDEKPWRMNAADECGGMSAGARLRQRAHGGAQRANPNPNLNPKPNLRQRAHGGAQRARKAS
eukprot:scaffold45253_cov48-Phaeocystis_antarctica.AAC.1